MSTTWSIVVGAAMVAGALGGATEGAAEADDVAIGAVAGEAVAGVGCGSAACWAVAPRDIVNAVANIHFIVRIAFFSKVFRFPVPVVPTHCFVFVTIKTCLVRHLKHDVHHRRRIHRLPIAQRRLKPHLVCRRGCRLVQSMSQSPHYAIHM